MSALTTARDTPMRAHEGPTQIAAREVKDGVVIWSGGIVVLEHGQATPARSAPGLVVLGVARGGVDNRTVPIVAKTPKRRVSVVSGVAQFENSAGGDAIGAGDVGAVCYLVDDRTLARTDGAGSRSPAGVVQEVSLNSRVWVDLGANPAVLT